MRAHGVSSSSSSSSSSRLAFLALLLLLVACFFFHSGAAAARPLPAAALDLPRARQENGVKAAADGLVLQQGATGNGHEVAELMGAAAEEVEACEEGNDDEDECVQRRLLRDAHLDYIYTQHKGRP